MMGSTLNSSKCCGQILKMKFAVFISKFFIFGRLLVEINQTWLALMPKIDNAVEVKDFRPISMVGCLYKLITKILAARLKTMMGELVGEAQLAFINGRQILDGALIANEVAWWLKKIRTSAVMLKLDFQKAYNTVKWEFLDYVMERMGFGRKWRDWIMQCVSQPQCLSSSTVLPQLHSKC